MKLLQLFFLATTFVCAHAHNGTPADSRAHSGKTHEEVTSSSALAPAVQSATSYSQEVLPEMGTASFAGISSKPSRGIRANRATHKLEVGSRKEARQLARVQQLEERVQAAQMNNTTSVLVGILLALVVVLAFAIDSTFGVILLLVAAVVALFILLR